jgi:hypothetical protein
MRRATPILVLLFSCAREAPPPAPAFEIPPRVVTPPPDASPPPERPPMRLADDPAGNGMRVDVDAGGFAAPKGAFAVVRTMDGEQTPRILAKSVFACATESGTSYTKIAVVAQDAGAPILKVVATDAKKQVADCLVDRLKVDTTLRTLEAIEIEIILRK